MFAAVNFKRQTMDYQLVIDKILTEVESLRGVGKQATYSVL